MTVTREDAEAAAERIDTRVRRTPVVRTGPGALGVEHDLVLKLESLQHAGSFKVRGSFNTALSQPIPEAGLIAASGGNHGIAVAHVARDLGVPAEIFVPGVAAAVKLERIRARGATVHVIGELYDDAQIACNVRAVDSGALEIHPYDAPATIAGQATMGLELIDQLPAVDTVLVAVGGGGLAAGLAAALPPTVRLMAVEPVQSSCFHAALRAGEPVSVEVSGVGADSLGPKEIGDMPWLMLADRAESILVSDDAIVEARRRLWTEVGILSEHGGATALAALTSAVYRPLPGEVVAVIICGSNTDPGDLVDYP